MTPFKMMYNKSMLRHRFLNERWGGGGGGCRRPEPPSSHSVKVCTFLKFLYFTQHPYWFAMFLQIFEDLNK